MRLLLPLILLAFLGCTSTQDVKLPKERYDEATAKLKKGMTKQQVSEVMGKPNNWKSDVWLYWSGYYATSMYSQCEIRFKEGKVGLIKEYGGCDYLVPIDEE